MDILAIMDLAAVLEERVALLYHGFAGQFHANQAGFLFWEQLSLEEKRHADMVRTYRHQRLILPISRKSHPELVSALEEVQRIILEQLRQVEREHIRWALEAALDIEDRLCQAHLARSSEVADPLLKRLLVKLGQEDQRHRKMILELSRSVSAGK